MKYFITIFIALSFFGCGGSNEKANNNKPVSTYQAVEKDTQTLPEQGGYGFPDGSYNAIICYVMSCHVML